MSEHDVDQFLLARTLLLCICEKYSFVDKNYGHTLMDDLRKIKTQEV